MSVASEIARLQNAKASIKTSIENKGVTVGDGTIDTYASKIDEISTSSAVLGTKTITANGTFVATDDNLDGFSSVVVNVPSGGTPVKSNVYRVPTIEARDAITDMVEGDICVVYESNISNVTVDSRFQTAIFPEVVVLDTAITGYVDVRYRAVDESIMFDCQGSLNRLRFRMDCFMGDNSIRIEYTSEDGITYTRTDTTGNPVDFGTEIYYEMPEMWNNAIGKFIQAGSINFEGIFQYKDNSWSYANINISTPNDGIYKDYKSYTNDGIIVGTLGLNPSNNLDDVNAKLYSELSVLYNNLDEIIAPENSSNLYSDSSIYTIPSKINGKSLLNTSNVTNMSNMFYNCKSLITIPQLDTSKVTNMEGLFSRCSSLTTIPQLNTSNVTNMHGMFRMCSSLTSIPQLDTSKVTNMNEMFNSCSSLTSIPQLDTSNATSLFSMFGGCSKLTAIPQLNTSNVTDMGNMFYNCFSLTTIPQLDTSNVTSISRIFWSCDSLTNLGGFTNLGQAYETTQNANYDNYTLNLSYSNNLTHDSLMNVINNLYNIANKGVKTQQLVLGSTNISKLSAEEIQIATDKGFSVL